MGITIEVLEYDAATASLVTVKAPRHWEANLKRSDQPGSAPRRAIGGGSQ
jgi:hypothetical protein